VNNTEETSLTCAYTKANERKRQTGREPCSPSLSLEADCIRWSYAKLPAALQKGDENLLAQLKGQSNQADVTTQRRGALAY
jgi:hypothetical protein